MKKLLVFATVCIMGCNGAEPSKNTDDTVTIEGTPAIVDVSQQIENEPDNPELYALRGRLFYEEEQYMSAASDLTRAVELDSTNFDYYHLLADAYFDGNQSKPALQVLEKVVAIDSTRINSLLKLGEMLMILRQHEASLSTVQKILRQDARHPEGFYLAGLNFEQMGDTARAIVSFQTTVEEDPDHIDAYRKLGTNFDKRDQKIALKYYDNALRIDSTDMESLMGKAWYFHQRSRLKEAKTYYEKAAAFHPFEPRIHFNNGILHLEMKDTKTAYKKFDIAVEVDQQFGKGYYYRAYAGERISKKEEDIISDYRQAAAFMDDPKPAYEALKRFGAR